METHSTATAATSVAEIEKFLSRRQQRRCILVMETTLNLVATVATQMLPRVHSTQWKHPVEQLVPSRASFKIAPSGEENVVFFTKEVQKYDCITVTSIVKVIKSSVLRWTAVRRSAQSLTWVPLMRRRKFKMSGMVATSIWRKLSRFHRDLGGMLFPYPLILQALTDFNTI